MSTSDENRVQEGGATSSTNGTKRKFCDGCQRPAKVCLCSSFPDNPEVCSCLQKDDSPNILVLQHPLERKQKHQTAWMIKKCFGSKTSLVVSRKLELDVTHPFLVFPLGATKTTANIDLPPNATLIFLDATWKCAKEMTASTSLKDLPRVALDVPADVGAEFVVRKPEIFEGPDGKGITGFSTAEALALVLDSIAHRSNTKHQERFHHQKIQKVIQAYVNFQLHFTTNVKHRTDRPEYIPGLYEKRNLIAEDNTAKIARIEEKKEHGLDNPTRIARKEENKVQDQDI